MVGIARHRAEKQGATVGALTQWSFSPGGRGDLSTPDGPADRPVERM